MRYFPIFLDIQDQLCLLVGAGQVALRKARLLLSAGAKLVVVAPEACEEMQLFAQSGQIQWQSTAFEVSQVAGMHLVVAATNDDAVNQQVALAAKAQQIPVNVVDAPQLCSYITPAIVDRDPVTVAISTAGTAPVLARQIRSQIEQILPQGLGKLASFIGRWRTKIKARLSVHERKNLWESFLQQPCANQVQQGESQVADAWVESELSNPKKLKGEVYIVGAGPGDPDLLTVKAMHLMQQVDVVLYDRLVSSAILDRVRRDADRIYVGKQRSNHAMPQETINETLVRLAKVGKKVLRLKGGDPFIFGRGGEEIETLKKNQVSFQVVPGITAASGCAAYAGIPLTHRDHAQSVRFITGHTKDGVIDLPWKDLAQGQQTLVIYMGLVGLSQICQQLIQHGLDRQTPIALVEQGTTEQQKVLVSTLADMPTAAQNVTIRPPTLVMIGQVVRLRSQLAWFTAEQTHELDPDAGKRKPYCSN